MTTEEVEDWFRSMATADGWIEKRDEYVKEVFREDLAFEAVCLGYLIRILDDRMGVHVHPAIKEHLKVLAGL